MKKIRQVKIDPTKVSTYSYYQGSRSRPSNKRSVAPKKSMLRAFRSVRSRLSFFRVVVVVVVLVAIGMVLSVNSSPIIRFSYSGVNARSGSDYRQGIQEIINSSLFNRTKLTFDYKSVEKQIISRFPEAESALVSFDIFGRRPVVKLSLHPPTYIFNSKGESWIVDDRGVIIAKAIDVEEPAKVGLVAITDEIGLTTDIGKNVLSTKEAEFLNRVIELVSKQLVSISMVYIPTVPKELDLVTTTESWRYKLSTEEKASAQAGALLAVRQSLKDGGQRPTEYVDLRAVEKVYWK